MIKSKLFYKIDYRRWNLIPNIISPLRTKKFNWENISITTTFLLPRVVPWPLLILACFVNSFVSFCYSVTQYRNITKSPLPISQAFLFDKQGNRIVIVYYIVLKWKKKTLMSGIRGPIITIAFIKVLQKPCLKCPSKCVWSLGRVSR